jgi:hypothetical protein
VVDVIAKVRGRPPAGVSAYDGDYAAIGYAKRLADEHAVAVVLVHHVRKAAAADATLVLKRPRGEADGILYITGRDVDEAEHALRFAPESGTWSLLDGPAVDYTVSASRAAVLRHLRACPGDALRSIADATGIGYETVKKTCQRMANSPPTRPGATARPTRRGQVPRKVSPLSPLSPLSPNPSPPAPIPTTSGDTGRGQVSPSPWWSTTRPTGSAAARRYPVAPVPAMSAAT